MGNETHIDGKWVFMKLRVCGHLRVVEKLYSDWLKTNSTLTGFGCEVTGEKSEEKFNKIKEFISNHQLPLSFHDMPENKKLVVLKIIKYNAT